MERPIYLDYNATTPLDPAAFEAMVPYLQDRFGNPSSGHHYGHAAHDAVTRGRAEVASLLGAQPEEIVFTGGGSESDNLAIKGVVARQGRGAHVITSAVEHPAVLNTLDYLRATFGTAVTVLPVDESGMVRAADLAAALRPETVLVTIIHANNETGTIQPIRELAAVARAAGVLFHTDAAQSVGKIELRVRDLDVDLLTVAAHKLYGPKGIGALYVRSGVQLDPLIHGGGQEHGLRSGTENVASIAGFGAACRVAQGLLPGESSRLRALRDALYDRLAERVPDIRLNGHRTERLPNTLNVSFPGTLGQDVLDAASGIAASTGSACHAGVTEPSSVLLAIGLSRDRALGAVRLSLGRWTTAPDIEQAAEILVGAHQKARQLAATSS